MKLFLVSGAAPFSTRDVWEGYINAFRSHGIVVVPYPLFSVLSYLSVDATCNDIIGKALDVRNDFDATVFIDGLFFREARAWVPLTLTAHGMTTVLVPTDDPYETVADEAYQIRFTNERTMTRGDVPYLPVAADLTDFSPQSIEQDIDILFLGTIFEDRWPIIRDLARYCEVNRIRFEAHGHFVANPAELLHFQYAKVFPGTVTASARTKLYLRSKIILNIFRASDSAESANPRIYEVAAMGESALLTSRRAEVSELFGDAIYEFSSFEELVAQLRRALGDSTERSLKIATAKEVARTGHLYSHRAPQIVDSLLAGIASSPHLNQQFPAEQKVAWIFGAGRTGSTWLLEMLQSLSGLVTWNEPCFGWAFTTLSQHPRQLERDEAFFRRQSLDVWANGLKSVFLDVAAARWPGVPSADSLVVKEVNAPEIAPFWSAIFPFSKFILLVRDPFDVLDSHIDMQRKGSWNDTFWQAEQTTWTEDKRIQFLAAHIERSFSLALQGFKNCREQNRLRLSYEELLANTRETLWTCVRFLGIDATPEEVDAICDRHTFDKFEGRKGRAFFRRFGRSCIWQESSNFTGEVRKIAEHVLGPIRATLGYGRPVHLVPGERGLEIEEKPCA